MSTEATPSGASGPQDGSDPTRDLQVPQNAQDGPVLVPTVHEASPAARGHGDPSLPVPNLDLSGLTVEQVEFLRLFLTGPKGMRFNRTACANAAGVTYRAYAYWASRPGRFKEVWAIIRKVKTDAIIDVLEGMAMDGDVNAIRLWLDRVGPQRYRPNATMTVSPADAVTGVQITIKGGE